MRVRLTPLDTLFCRDSSPFDKGASPQAEVSGTFPPHPPTIAGALRAALARRNGWNGHGRWAQELNAVIGDGPSDVGVLQIDGPFVLRDDSPVFPMPRHIGCVERGGDKIPAAMFLPADATADCDLGAARLPRLPKMADGERLASAEDLWVSARGLRQILAGSLPDMTELVTAAELWSEERRVGIARDTRTRTTGEGDLYSTRHVRLGKSVCLGVEVQGLPAEWPRIVGDLIPLGGERRVASVALWESEWSLSVADDVALGRDFVLIAVTPVLVDRDVFLGRAPLPGLRARIISACADRPLRIGGWDTLRRNPLPLKNALPAGTTLFCRADESNDDVAPRRRGLLSVGAGTSLGFGLCAAASILHWKDRG